MSRKQIIAVMVVLCIVLTVYARMLFAPLDDAYIFLVYARNFVEGHGLTFNGTRVEGVSSALWMPFAILAESCNGLFPAWKGIASLSLACGFCVVIATIRLARSYNLSTWWLPAAMLVITPSFAFYAGSGMETALATLICTLAVTDRRRSMAPVWAALLFMVRPDLIIVGLVMIAWLGWPAPKRIVAMLAVVAILILPLEMFRVLYYGDWVPNTIRAKSAGLQPLLGLQYLWRSGFLFWPVILAMVMLKGFTRLGALILAAYTIPLTLQGGDVFLGARVFVPFMPLVYVEFVRTVETQTPRVRWMLVLICILTCIINWNVGLAERMRRENIRCHWGQRKPYADFLIAHFPSDTVLATGAAGWIPYATRFPTIDMGVLCDPVAAHDPIWDKSQIHGHQVGNGKSVLDRQPDVIEADANNPGVAMKQIMADPRWNDYEQPWPAMQIYVKRAAKKP